MAPDAVCTEPIDNPEAVVADLVARYDRPAETREILERIIPCLGVPILSATTSDDTVSALLQGPDSVVLSDQLDDISQGLVEGVFVDFEGFAADLAAQGLVDAQTGQPVSGASFEAGILRVAGEGGEDSLLPRLVVALARERAARDGEAFAPDSWGASDLDLLQLLLIGLGLVAIDENGAGAGLPARALAATSSRQWGVPLAAPAPHASLQGVVRNGGSRSAPATQTSGPALCATAHAQHTNVNFRAPNPGTVWHKFPGKPDTTNLAVVVSWTPYPRPYVLLRAGCPQPSGALQSGRAVYWGLDAKGHEHGSLSTLSSTTDGSGGASVSYTTVAETTAEPDQIPPNEQRAQARAALEVEGAIPVPGGGSVSIKRNHVFTVKWYEPKIYNLVVDLTFSGRDDKGFGADVHVVAEIQVRPTSPTVPDGTPRIFRGTGTAAFITTEKTGAGHCEHFLWSGGGNLPAFAEVSVVTRDATIDFAQLRAKFAIRFDRPPRDSVTAVDCDGGSFAITKGPPSLIQLFLAALKPRAGELVVTTWRPGLRAGEIALADEPGRGAPEQTCETACRLSGTYRFETYP